MTEKIAADAGSPPNPLDLNGLSFVEYCGASAGFYFDLFSKMGMSKTAESDDGTGQLYEQGAIKFIATQSPGSFAAHFADQHGPCVSALGFRVKDAARAAQSAMAQGAQDLRLSEREKTLDQPVLKGVGGSALYLIGESLEADLFQRCFSKRAEAATPNGFGFSDVDHLTHCVEEGQHDVWVRFYEDIFNFVPVFEIKAQGQLTGMRTTAVLSPCGRFRIAINEPTEPTSQIQEFINDMKGEGIQHIALASHDLYQSLGRVRDSNLPFQEVPDSYYEMVDDRLPGHGENIARMKALGILLDGDRNIDGDWGLLLQIFSKNLIGPVFFEFIQRKGNDGFGEGNAQALFDSIERDQIERGTLAN